MDSSPKDQSTSSSASGEIFTGEHSAYQDALAAVTEDVKPGMESTSQTVPIPEGAVPAGPGSDTYIPPPPFAEDNRKKFIVVVVIVLFILLFLFAFISMIRRLGSRTPPKQNVTLTYWGLWEPPTVMQPIIDEYQRTHPEVTVNYLQSDPKQYRERLQAAIDRGEGPDIFRFHNTWVPMLANQLSAVPESVFTDETFTNTFYPVAKEDLKVGNTLAGIPLEIDGIMLFYNEDILKGANVDVPKTWIDMQEAVGKLTVLEGTRVVTSAIALGTAENIEHFSDILSLMILQNGTNIKTSLFSCTDASSTTCAVEALSFYRKFAETGQKTWDDTLENSILAFTGGKVAMIVAPSWQAHVIKSIAPTLNFKTAPVPQLPCDREPCPLVHMASYWVEGVSSKSSSKTAAWEFLKFLSQKETMEKIYTEQVKVFPLFGEPPARVDMAQSLADNIYLAPLLQAAPSMKSFYAISRTNDGETGLNTTLINYLKDAVNSLREGTSPETALKTAGNGFVQVFARFGLTYTNPAE